MNKKTKVTFKKWLVVMGGIGAAITILAYIKEQQDTAANIAPANIYQSSLALLTAFLY